MSELIAWMVAGILGLLIGTLIGRTIAPLISFKLVKWKTEHEEKRRLEEGKAEIKAKYGYDVETWEEYNARVDKEGGKVNG